MSGSAKLPYTDTLSDCFLNHASILPHNPSVEMFQVIYTSFFNFREEKVFMGEFNHRTVLTTFLCKQKKMA